MNSKLLILTIFSIDLMSTYGEQSKDNLCPHLIPVLCVKDKLIEIHNNSEKINNIARKVQERTFQEVITFESLQNFTIQKISQIRLILSSKHHDEFRTINSNVNEIGLIDLINEEYEAYAYLYKSIKTLLNIQFKFSSSIRKDFAKILDLIEDNLCNYRSIYHVYSQTWLTMDQINEITFSKTRKRSTLTVFYHYSYSIIITQLLQEWFNKISRVLENMEKNYLR